MKIFLSLIILLTTLQSAGAEVVTYDLEVKKQNVFITKKAVESLTVNDQIPAPILHFKEGDEAVINVKNSSDEVTSLHWHGLILPGEMDGVPGLNNFNGIAPNETFTYRFKIKQSGTYWYHSHSNLQEQRGLYGAIVITPKNGYKKQEKFDQEYVILFSDFTEENASTILNNLKMDSGYYNYGKRTVGDFFGDSKKYGFIEALKDRLSWGEMRMDPTDLADVTKYHFLVNGKTNSDNLQLLFKPNQRLRLRFINASAMSIYDVTIPGLKMKLVAADGQPVKPVTIDEFRFGVAETYDVIVTPKKNQPYMIAAQAIDRSGQALATLTPKSEMMAQIPQMRPRTLLTMADMKMADMHHENMTMQSGWADASTPDNHKALNYQDLVALTRQKDLRQPEKEIVFNFGGTMNRYIWTINGEQFPQPFTVKQGERIRLKFVNDTMMAHPIHLHGMFMQLENGQKPAFMPNKHTILLPPAQTITTILSASEAGQWAFHCHLLYHMASGMMTSINVEK